MNIMNLDFAYRCDDFVIITDADSDEFKEVLEKVKENECWEVNDVDNALREEGFTSNTMLIHLHF